MLIKLTVSSHLIDSMIGPTGEGLLCWSITINREPSFAHDRQLVCNYRSWSWHPACCSCLSLVDTMQAQKLLENWSLFNCSLLPLTDLSFRWFVIYGILVPTVDSVVFPGLYTSLRLCRSIEYALLSCDKFLVLGYFLELVQTNLTKSGNCLRMTWFESGKAEVGRRK